MTLGWITCNRLTETKSLFQTTCPFLRSDDESYRPTEGDVCPVFWSFRVVLRPFLEEDWPGYWHHHSIPLEINFIPLSKRKHKYVGNVWFSEWLGVSVGAVDRKYPSVGHHRQWFPTSRSDCTQPENVSWLLMLRKQSLTLLYHNRNQLITSLQEIDKTRERMVMTNQEVKVPPEVFDYIDQGRNPQLYTKDCMEKALTENECVKGKIDGYRRFKSLLMAELSKVFSNEMVKYKSIRGDERPWTWSTNYLRFLNSCTEHLLFINRMNNRFTDSCEEYSSQ